MGPYNLPSSLQFTFLHMCMPLPSTIWHKRFQLQKLPQPCNFCCLLLLAFTVLKPFDKENK